MSCQKSSFAPYLAAVRKSGAVKNLDWLLFTTSQASGGCVLYLPRNHWNFVQRSF